MRILLTTLLSTFLFTSITWQTDFDKAKVAAKTEHKYILINFSGSDWCGPCIRMHKEIFENDSFTQYAADHLVLVNADFPRLKKHALTASQQKKNDHLADMYNKQGVFPFTVILSPDGKVLKKWEGYPQESAEAFTNEVKALLNASK